MTRTAGCCAASRSAISPDRSGEASSTMITSCSPPREPRRARAFSATTPTVRSSLNTGKRTLTARSATWPSERQPPDQGPRRVSERGRERPPVARVVDHADVLAEVPDDPRGEALGLGPGQGGAPAEGEVRVEVADDVELDDHARRRAAVAQALEEALEGTLGRGVDDVRAPPPRRRHAPEAHDDAPGSALELGEEPGDGRHDGEEVDLDEPRRARAVQEPVVAGGDRAQGEEQAVEAAQGLARGGEPIQVPAVRPARAPEVSGDGLHADPVANREVGG